jgi:RNA polymerase sporulation-specific sigma factor
MNNILEYEKLVSKIASKYSNYSNYEDLKQVGMIGLLKALDKYENNNNTKFSTYAYLWIKGEILEYLRCDRNIKISKELLSLCKEVTLTEEILRNKLNKEPTIKEIAFFLEKDESDIEEAMLSKELVLSCDYSLNNDDDSKNVDLYDCIPYYEKGYNEDYLDLYNALNDLSEEEKEIINMRYFNDMTQSEISKKLGTNQVNISRKEEKILCKLNKSLVA